MRTLQKNPELPLNMAISNELSSEIAAAILVDKKSPQELHRLKDIILRVHVALQEMSQEARAIRLENKGVQPRKTTSPDSTSQ